MTAARAPEDVLVLVLGGLAVILLVARLAGGLMRRLGQPVVIGEVVGGILLGPSLLGAFDVGGRDLSVLLFPFDVRPYLLVVAQLGLVIYMFIVGLELDLRLIRSQQRAAISISVLSVAAPFVLGTAVGALLHGAHDVATTVAGDEVSVGRLPFALFVGLAISGSAFAILARILDERRLLGTRMGMVLMGSAAVDDLAVWSLAAIVLAVAGSDAGAPADVATTFALLVVLAAVLFRVVRPALQRYLLPRFSDAGVLQPDALAVLLVLLLAAAGASAAIGVSPILGAFLFGAAIPREGADGLAAQVTDRLETVSVLLLLPVFFAATGLNVDLLALGVSGLPLLGLMVLVASGGKFAGASVAARFEGFRGRRALAVGVLMNTRGLTELAILSIGVALPVLDREMFTVLVMTAIVSTVASGPLLRLVYPDPLVERDIHEFERDKLRATAAYRVVALVEDPPAASDLVDVASTIAAAEATSEVVLTHFIRARGREGGLGSGLADELEEMATSMDGLRSLCGDVEARGVAASSMSQITSGAAADLIDQLKRVGADLLLMDEPSATGCFADVVADPPCDVAVVSSDVVGRPTGTRGVTGIFGGGEHDRAVVEVSLRTAAGWRAPLTLLPEGGSPRGLRPSSVSQLVDRVLAARGGVASAEDGEPALVVVPFDAPPQEQRAVRVWGREAGGATKRDLGVVAERLTAGVPAAVPPVQSAARLADVEGAQG